MKESFCFFNQKHEFIISSMYLSKEWQSAKDFTLRIFNERSSERLKYCVGITLPIVGFLKYIAYFMSWFYSTFRATSFHCTYKLFLISGDGTIRYRV
jgi:hypothetical protein